MSFRQKRTDGATFAKDRESAPSVTRLPRYAVGIGTLQGLSRTEFQFRDGGSDGPGKTGYPRGVKPWRRLVREEYIPQTESIIQAGR